MTPTFRLRSHVPSLARACRRMFRNLDACVLDMVRGKWKAVEAIVPTTVCSESTTSSCGRPDDGGRCFIFPRRRRPSTTCVILKPWSTMDSTQHTHRVWCETHTSHIHSLTDSRSRVTARHMNGEGSHEHRSPIWPRTNRSIMSRARSGWSIGTRWPASPTVMCVRPLQLRT